LGAPHHLAGEGRIPQVAAEPLQVGAGHRWRPATNRAHPKPELKQLVNQALTDLTGAEDDMQWRRCRE
jgi:hypothetical protein